jgi:tetratricopeptide (TPR) repeat protein
MLKIGGGEEYILKGNERIGHLYGFLTAVAAHRNKEGNQDQAIIEYEKAIRIGPAQKDAYYELGRIYEARAQYGKAVETWSAYLKYDNDSLSAVELKNAVGQLRIRQKEFDKAYDVYLDSQRSGQAAALLGFAEASEKTGKTLQAEKIYQKAAQRYPQGGCPAELGVFYLRQNNPEMAFQVFREYQRFSEPGYYFVGLIGHCSQAGHPEEAVNLVRKVEQASPENWGRHNDRLAWAYAATGHYKQVADLLRPQSLGGNSSSWGLETYWDTMLKAGLSTVPELPAKGLSPHNRKGVVLEIMAKYLMRKGHYDEALMVLREMAGNPAFLKDTDAGNWLVQTALPWSMSKREERSKQEILDKLRGIGKDKWVESRVLFLLGQSDERRLMELADTEDNQGKAQYCLAFMKLRNGEKAEAQRFLLMSMENMTDGLEYWHARDVAEKFASY